MPPTVNFGKPKPPDRDVMFAKQLLLHVKSFVTFSVRRTHFLFGISVTVCLERDSSALWWLLPFAIFLFQVTTSSFFWGLLPHGPLRGAAISSPQGMGI